MENREDLQQQMLELIYGLLSDEESAELADRISSDRELAVTYAELKEQTELLADATRAAPIAPPDFAAWKQAAGVAPKTSPKPESSKPEPSKTASSRSRPATQTGGARLWTSRGLQVASALAACLLLFAVGYPFFVSRPQSSLAVAQQQTELANDFLALSITGPKLMAAQLPNQFQVSVQNAAQEPVDAEVEYTFKSSSGSTVYYGRTQAVDGEVLAQIPPDEVANAATLEVVARQGQARSQLGLDLQVAPQRPIAVLQTDRSFAEPGDTLNFRAVVLDPQTQQEQATPLEFYWKPKEAARLAEIPQAEPQTQAGVALGTLQVPENPSLEEIQLAVQSPLVRTNAAQTALPVIPPQQPQEQLLAAANLRRQRSIPQQQAFARGALAYKVVPEGGNLVAGVQNRIYYQALPQAALGEPAAMLPREAQVVDAQRQLIRNLPPSQTELGSFRFTPEATQRYSLELGQAAEQVEQPLVPVQQLPATLQVTNGVAPANEPLQVDVRVAQANTTMALVVGDDDAAIGHHVWDVGVNAPITQPVTLDLPDEATGAQRLRLYQVADVKPDSGSTAEPRLLAERIVYRIPTRRFDVAVEGVPQQAETGQALNLQIRVTDEYGGSAPALLGVQLQRVPEEAPLDFLPIGLEAEALLHSRVVLPEGNEPLPAELRALEQDPARFDQLLALAQWREASDLDGLPQVAAASEAAPEPLPVVRRSNLSAVLQEYQAAVTELTSHWEAQLEQIRQTSAWLMMISGGILAVCLLALAVIQGLPRVGIWGPGLLVALGSVLWGLLSFNLPLADLSTADRTLIARHEPAQVSQPLQEEMAAMRLNQQADEAAGNRPTEAAEDAPAGVQLRSAPAADAATDAPFSERGMGGLGGGNIAPFSRPDSDAAPRLMRGAAPPAAAPDDAFGPAAPSPETAAEPQAAAADMKEAEDSPISRGTSDPVVWQPRLPTDDRGQAALSVTLPQAPGRYRLLVDAHGSGRLGTIVRYVEVREPAVASPPPSPQ